MDEAPKTGSQLRARYGRARNVDDVTEIEDATDGRGHKRGRTMAVASASVRDDISKLIATGQCVYDRWGREVGTVTQHDVQTGWMKVEMGTLVRRELYVPLSLIAVIDAQNISLALAKAELYAAYSSPPASDMARQ